jgi:hypothetical protein
MTAYVVSGLGQAKAAGYKIDDDRRTLKGRAWLQSTLAAHPDMIPDLRAYVVYALATTGGAPPEHDCSTKPGTAATSSATKAWPSPAWRSTQAETTAAPTGRRNCSRRKLKSQTRCLLVRQLRRPAGLLGRHLGETTALALKLLVAKTAAAACCPKPPCGSASIATATTGTPPSRPPW